MRRTSATPYLILAAVIIGVLVFGGCVFSGVIYYVAQQTAASVPTRDQVREQLMGKTPSEVVAIYGPAERADNDAAGKPQYWLIRAKVVDQVSGSITSFVSIWFSDGRVSKVDF